MASQISYGNLGYASYSIAEQRWSFEKPLDVEKNVLSASDCADILPPTSTARAATKPKNDLRKLARRHPELQPATDVLQELPKEEKLPSSGTLSGAPTGKLFSKGLATSVDGDEGLPVFACPGGPNGEFLRITAVDGGITCHWTANSERICQIVFASATNLVGTLLAVRLSTSVLIFRPVWRKDERGQLSLEAMPVLLIPSPHSDAVLLADFAFNGADQRKIAVLDAVGRWIVLQLRGQYSTGGLFFDVAEVASGTLSSNDPSMPVTPESVQQENTLSLDNLSLDELDTGIHKMKDSGGIRGTALHLAKMLWIGELLIVYNRWHIFAIHAMSTQVVEHLLLPDEQSESYQSEILDIVCHPTHASMLFALSSRSLSCYEFRVDGNGWTSVNATLGLMPSLTWTHYRDQNDESLCVTVTSHEQGVFILIYSALSTGLDLLSCSTVAESNNGLRMACDHAMIRLPSIQPSRSSLDSPKHWLIDVGSDPSVGLCLYALFRDLAVRTWFVNREQSPKDTKDATITNATLSRLSTSIDAALDPWTVPNEKIYSRLCPPVDAKRSRADHVSFVEATKDVIYRLSGDDARPPGLSRDCITSTISATNITEADDAANNLLESFQAMDLQYSIAQHLGHGKASAALQPKDMTMPSELYDNAVRRWITPLARDVPAAYRLRLSSVANRIALDLYLSSIVIQTPIAHAEQDLDDDVTTQDQAVNTPKHVYEQSLSQLGSPQMPTYEYEMSSPAGRNNLREMSQASREVTPAVSIMSASSKSSAAGPNPGHVAHQQLGRWTEQHGPAQMLPSKMIRLLAHWEVGADPEQYSWSATRRQIERGGEVALARRAAKQARRALLRERRNATLAALKASQESRRARARSRTAALESSQVQPATQEDLLGMSSQSEIRQSRLDEGGAGKVASQVERGRFGGRPSPQKRPRLTGVAIRKKPRKAGF